MQDWQNSGQEGSAPVQGQTTMWSDPYSFSDNASHDQFGSMQSWQHNAPGQQSYSQMNGRLAPAEPSLYPSSHQNQRALVNEHDTARTLSHGNYHDTQGQFALDDSYPQANQDQAMQGLNFGQEVFGQQGGLAHEQAPQFARDDYQYPVQHQGMFSGHVQQYSEPQLRPQQHRQQSHTPIQHERFEAVPQSFSPTNNFSQPVQPAQARSVQPERGYTNSPHQFQAQPASLPTTQPFSMRPQPAFHQASRPEYQQQQQQPVFSQRQMTQPVQQSVQQSVQQPVQQPLQQPVQHPASRQSNYTQPSQSSGGLPSSMAKQSGEPNVQQQRAASTATFHYPVAQQPVATASPSTTATPEIDSVDFEQLAKKRKRVVKRDDETDVIESPREHAAKLNNEDEESIAPHSTKEELSSIAQFKKRSATAKKNFPPVPGAPNLITTGTIRVPAPKSYDRLAPMVALPSQSGKHLMPEIGHQLPCEIQGRFTSSYRPSTNFAGKPEDREKEAKLLIDQYQQEMKALGVRKPKYADYPFTFQEQLKSDEAAKSKAQRRARKEEEEERKKPVRPEVRPEDPVEAAAWDVLGIVHIDPSATRTSALIAGAVQSLGEFLIKLRTSMTRVKQEIDQAKKDKASAKELAELEQQAEIKRQMYVTVCEAATKHGDDAVLENLGGHQKGMLSMINVLIGCVKLGDYSGKLPKAVLQFMTNVSMTKRIADGVNFETVRKRFADKGDDEVKELIKLVASRIRKDMEPASAVGDVKKPAISGPINATTKHLKASIPGKHATDGSPVKRPLEEDGDSRPGKKQNIDGTSGVLGTKMLSKPTSSNTLQSKLAAARPRPASSSLAAKARPLVKPVTRTEPAKAEPSKADAIAPLTAMDIDQPINTKKMKPEVKVSKLDAIKATAAKAAPSSALSSIASLLDSINTPKPEGQVSQKDAVKSETPETAEERTKRMRKEARRSLRVTWRPEPELTQVRIFQKEAAEDEDNMTRDAADDRSEGMMLKRRATFTDEDDEDDEDDIPYRPWLEPGHTDLSVIPQDYRAKAYTTRGGTMSFTTAEQKFIHERELKELMAVYTDKSQIPHTPKSPIPESAVPDTETKIGQLPQNEAKYKEIYQRWTDTLQNGPDAAVYLASGRLDIQDGPAAKLQSLLGNISSTANTAANPEEHNYNMTPPQKHAQLAQLHAASTQSQVYVPSTDQVLAALRSEKVKGWRDTNGYDPLAPQTSPRRDYPDPNLQAIVDRLEEIFASFSGLPYPATEPPIWLTSDPERVREWWAGYQKDATARARAESAVYSQQAAVTASATASHTPAQSTEEAWAAYYQQLQQAQQAPQQAPQQVDQYAQLMALLQQTQGAPSQTPAQPLPSAVPPHSSTIGDAQMQALLAQLNQPAMQPAVQPQSTDWSALNPKDQGYQQLMMLTQMQQQKHQPQSNDQRPSHHGELDYSDSYDHRNYDQSAGREWDDDGDRSWEGGKDWEGGDRDYRQRRDGWDRSEHDSRRDKNDKHGKGRKGIAPGGATLAPHRPANKALIGTKPCVFWQQGKCARGDKCTFRHDD